MQFTQLGRTGVKVSRLCLGTMSFGSYTPEAESVRLMNRAVEHGINLFNIAEGPAHSSTEFLGRWLAEEQGRRDRVMVAVTVAGIWGLPPQDNLSALSIRKTCDAYLQRLHTDYLDLFQIAHIFRATPWEEVWQAMEHLVQAGKILYVGSANFAGWHIAQANEAARKRNFLGLVSEQSVYNLLSRELELEVIPACEAYGVGLLPWSPLSGGVLGGALQPTTVGRRADKWAIEAVERHRAKLEAYERICNELGESPAGVALAWLLHNPVVTAPIIGPRMVEQLEQAVSALDLHLSDEALAKLNEIFPGVGIGGPAPEAYAW